jgi:hypothetical protein
MARRGGGGENKKKEKGVDNVVKSPTSALALSILININHIAPNLPKLRATQSLVGSGWPLSVPTRGRTRGATVLVCQLQ